MSELFEYLFSIDNIFIFRRHSGCGSSVLAAEKLAVVEKMQPDKRPKTAAERFVSPLSSRHTQRSEKEGEN
jgi:hypothetical protein